MTEKEISDNSLKKNQKKLMILIEGLLKKSAFQEALNAAQSVGDRATRYAVLASINFKAGDLQQSEVLFQRALKINPDHSLAITNYAKLLIHQKKYKAAFPYAEKAYKEAPKIESLVLPYCQCLAELDRFGEAVNAIAPFLEQEKPSVAIMNAYLSLLRADLRHDEALASLDRALALYPDELMFKKAAADIYTETDPYKAIEAYTQLAKLDDSIQAKWNRSFVKLRLENFSDGWIDYEAGLDEKIGKIGRPLPAQTKGIRLVTDLYQLDEKKWTIFSGEQGLGDQILFLGALNEAIKQFPKSIYITEERLIPILERSFPDISCVTYAFGLNLFKQDHRMNGIFPVGSLQKYFRQSKSDFIQKRKVPYLYPNPTLTQKFKERLKDKIGDKKLIGVSWRGGFWDRQVRTKSFELNLLEPLMTDPDTIFLSLQYGDVSKERKYARENSLPITFVDGIDFKKDLDAWFALACLCDKVISVSTALVHFLGAANRPVELLLSNKQGPFIWGLGIGESLPYPTVKRHRQLKTETVDMFIDRISKDIL